LIPVELLSKFPRPSIPAVFARIFMGI